MNAASSSASRSTDGINAARKPNRLHARTMIAPSTSPGKNARIGSRERRPASSPRAPTAIDSATLLPLMFAE